MKIEVSEVIHHPIDQVFAAFRDRLGEVVTLLDDVESVTVVDRKDEGDITRMHNLWRPQREIPAVMKRYITPDMMKWDDFAVYDNRARRCEWRLGLYVFDEAVDCAGVTSYHEVAGGTRVQISGHLEVDLRKVKVVPRLLRRSLGPRIEQFVVSLIQPNMAKTNQAVAALLDQTS